VVLVILAMTGVSIFSDAYALTIRFGEDVTITEMNWHEAWEIVPTPTNPGTLPPDLIEHWSTGSSAHTFVGTSASDPSCQDGQSGNAYANVGIEFNVEGEEGQNGSVKIIINFSTSGESILNGGGTADAILYKRYEDHGEIYRALCTTFGEPTTSCQQAFERTDETITFSTILEVGKTYQIGFHVYSHADICGGISQALSDVTVNSIKVEFAALWAIDIKPGSDPNRINPKKKGVIPVAILTTDSFDAATVDETTVLFGPTGTEAAPVHSALEDVDGDGDTDMILHFKTQDTGIRCGDTSASLTGETFSGQALEGSDSIKTVGCK